MKKTIALIAALFAGTVAIARGTDFGLHVGWNNAKLNLEQLKVTTHGGFTAGAFLRLNSGKLYLEPSFNFASKGCKVSSREEIMKYSSIDIPLVAGVYIIRLKYLNARLFAGPGLSLLTNKPRFENLDLHPGKTAWNAKIGAGADAGNLILDVDYSFGLNDIGGKAKKERSLTLTLGFKIF